MRRLLGFAALLLTQLALADPVIINNNYSSQPAAAPAAPAPAAGGCAAANQNNIYDPRVPPAGVYSTRNSDGSSQTTYTTGEKKPYIVDNNCNGGQIPNGVGVGVGVNYPPPRPSRN